MSKAYTSGALTVTCTSAHTQRLKRLKVPTFVYCHLQGNPNRSGLQFEVMYWQALPVGGVAQLAAAHCPNELTLDPQ